MDELAAIRVFTFVAEAGSFSEAGRRLGMSTSSVSRQISSLEESIDVRLFKRSTRNLVLTEAGQTYLASVAPALRQLELARRTAHAYQRKISGSICVHARMSAGAEVIVPALPLFFEQYPDVEIDIALTDERVDLLSHGVDVAVWLGTLDDSNMVARQLSESRRVVCASPGYLARHGIPGKPEDLVHHSCLIYQQHNYLKEWRFRKGSELISTPVSGRLRTSNSAALITGAKGGLGLVMLQGWMVRKSVQEGLLQTVLSDYEAYPTDQDTSLYVVYPHRDRLPLKVRVFVDFLVQLFAPEANAGQGSLPSR
ncbi:LysR family transcriptional regulator [Bordetella sp. BOR01]|uniref:LysR family transcriptional regulator n=1 Tax=Bordetella sp. BOR01 TaxID=2854779 RepID=UPI001C488115|nr:LysR family transcriptional regulator [Bordetella sp. BOR01]MBV7482131.1 LysR family transcriptional regulator [Bordetella sp. BOR01]